MFSGHVSRVLLDKIHAPHGACDWVMGWASTEGHPDSQPFLSSPDLLSLLNVLWENRKLFVQALFRTYFPGLSGVIFVLWRYTCSSSESASISSNKLMTAPFCEILWRSMLVATEDQFTTLHFINNFVYYEKKVDFWDKSPKYVDLEDSCTLLDVLSARLVPTDRRLFKPMSMLPLVSLLKTVMELIQPGSEGCYPALLTGLVERFWTALEENELPEDIILTAGSVFLCLGELLEPLDHNRYSSRTAKVDLVKALEQHDFLELLGRLILLLEPSDEPSPYSPHIPRNSWFLANTLHIVTTLVNMAPDRLLIDQFEARIDDWYRVEHALLLSKYIEGSYPDTYQTLHHQCLRTWWCIGERIGLERRAQALARYECSYSRCPQGKNLFFVEFTCHLCFGEKLRYCSALCQSKDWTLDHGGGSHRQRCRPKTRPPVRASGIIDMVGRQD
ncbi:hypothetical protein B0J17DRAFT_229568 [Rhizoctonia solani]|nr:hypothetical protein B0J17DRAFT_229568 [Rhizoctonia solani]